MRKAFLFSNHFGQIVKLTFIVSIFLFFTIVSFAQADAKVEAVYTLGQIPIPFGSTDHVVKARVTNNGSVDLNNLNVTLNITGANIFSNSKIINLPVASSIVVVFDPFTPLNIGTNTLTVSVPADDDNTNNSAVYTQVVNNNTFSYADTAPPDWAEGFNTSGGLFLTKYTMTGSGSVTGVRVYINTAANTGNTIYAVVLNTAGVIIAQSEPYITDAPDLDAYKEFNIINPPTFANTDFYVGLAQTPNVSVGYAPASGQIETNPTRPEAYYLADLTGGNLNESVINGRFMIQAIVGQAPQNDARVAAVYTLGQLPLPSGVPHIIQSRVINMGINTLTNLSVTLSVSGDNTYINTKVITLAPNDTTLINFDPFLPTSVGNNNITVSVPQDDNNANNSSAYMQIVNSSTFSYADGSAPAGSGGMGYNNGSSLVKYSVTGTASITNVNVHLNSTQPAGNTIHAIVLNAAGTLVGTSAPYVTVAGDLGTYKQFIIINPPTITNSDFFVGLVQAANGTTPYYPVSLQQEEFPGKPGAFYSGYSAGGVQGETYQKYMIQAVVSPNPPSVTDVGIDAVYTLGKMPLSVGNYNHVIQAKITNHGTTSLNGFPVTLNVGGANSFTNTKFISIASGETTIVNFDAFSPWNLGNNTITVTLPGDDNNSNNNSVYTQIVNGNTFSYADGSPETGMVGYAGMVLTQYWIKVGCAVSRVRVHISNDLNNVGNTVYGVVTNGFSILGQSAPHIITVAELGSYVNFDIINPPIIEFYDYISFYAGLLATSPIAANYQPVSYQNEGNPTRSGAYFFSEPDGTGITEHTDVGRFMIEADVNIVPQVFNGVNSNPNYLLAGWDFSNTNSPVSFPATAFDTSLSFQPVLTRGPGAPPSSGAHSFRTTGFQNDGIQLSNTDYFQASLSPKMGDTLALSSIEGLVHSNNNNTISSGVGSQFAFSLDGINFTLLGSPFVTTDINGTIGGSLSDIPALQNIVGGTTVTFRYYASGEAALNDWGFISYSPGTNGFSIYGRVVSSNTIITNPVIPTGADYILTDCSSVALGSIGFTSTGHFSPENKYLVELGRLEQIQPNIFRYYIVDTIGSLSSNANSGVVDFTIPAGIEAFDQSILKIKSTAPVVQGTLSQPFNIVSPQCESFSRGSFRSRNSGNWNDINTWESSWGGVNWIPATLVPNENAYRIEISIGDTVSITTNVASRNLNIKGTLRLLNGNTDNGTIMLNAPLLPGPFNPINVLGIDSSGVFQVISSAANYYDVFNVLNGKVWIGGRITIGDGVTPVAGGFENFATTLPYSYWLGGTFEWNCINGVPPRTDTTYFADGNGGYPTFRITNIPGGVLGGTSNTIINGTLEVNTPVNWIGSGTKTFRDGIKGSSTVTQNPGCGKFFTTSSYQVIPNTDSTFATLKGTINGTVNIILNSDSGYTLINGATIPDTANVRISGQTRSFQKIELQQGARMTIDPASTLDIQNADLVNKGMLSGAGTVQFTGNTASYINSPGIITAPILLVNKELYLAGNTNTADINLTSYSHLKLDSFYLNMGTGNLVGDSVNFIVTNDTGRLMRVISTPGPVIFPVGFDTSSYTPVTITNSGSTDNFQVRVDSTISHVNPSATGNVNRTWYINDSAQSSSNLTVKVQWNESNEQVGFDRTNSFLSQSHYCQPPPNCVDEYFDVISRTAALGNGPYTQTRDNISDPSSFIVKSSADTSTFTGNAGNGDWNDPLNWTIGIVPSLTIGMGKVIVINYTNGIPCVVNGDIIVEPGGTLLVSPGKLLNVSGNIIGQ